MSKIKHKKGNDENCKKTVHNKIKAKKNRRQRLIHKKHQKLKTKVKDRKRKERNSHTKTIYQNLNSKNVSSIKNDQKKFKPVYLIQKPEDISGNWKQIKEIIGSNNSKKKRKITPVQEKENDPKINEGSPVEETEVWFDNVDPILLEESIKEESIPLKVNSDKSQTGLRTLSKISESDSSVSRLVKDNSYTGLTKIVGLDCEMVGGGENGVEDLLARVSIVNHYGNAIYDEYVKPSETIVDYRTHVSGIRPENLTNAKSFLEVQKEVSDLLRGRIIVGHALSNDFRCLLFTHPKHLTRDTSSYKPFKSLIGGGTPSLRKLAEKILGIEIQKGEHSSIQDAQTAMRLYTLNRKEWEMVIRDNKKRFKRREKSKNKINANKSSEQKQTQQEKIEGFSKNKKRKIVGLTKDGKT